LSLDSPTEIEPEQEVCVRAVVVHETGGVEVLRLEESERPEPADGEILVRIHALSVNPIDWKYRQGLMPKQLPVILGSDAAGTVEVSRAEGFGEGEDVFGLVGSGSYAEYGIGLPTTLAHKPGGLSEELAAALPVAGLTSWQALFDRGKIRAEETVLISGGPGGVGHLAVQFAKNAGAKVIATGSSRNREFVLGLGADEYVAYDEQDLADAVSDVDLAFDTVGGETTGEMLDTVRRGGKLITIAGPPPERAAELGVDAQLLMMSPDAAQLERIAVLVVDGIIKPEIAEVFRIEDVQRAHALSESRRARGKIILTV
jgi:NADPH:quinone reductase-like Zn-dependent oxidoreductase